jgi:predicted nucleic acid-binding protein
MEAVIVDTGVWYAMFDSRDPNYGDAEEKIELISMLKVAVLWPTAYETLRTKFVRKSLALQQFETFLKSPNIEFIDDDPFREDAFQLSLESSLRRSRPLSMVDCLIRLALDDTDLNIRFLATFNARDFIDVCRRNRVEII